jgi:preprotein translocase subunit YajC
VTSFRAPKEIVVEALMFAQDNGNSSASGIGQLIFFALILGGIFYFLIIRPNRTRVKRHQELMSTLELGDEVQTVGGIFGVVQRLDDESAVIQVEDGGSLRISRRAIAAKITEEPEPE